MKSFGERSQYDSIVEADRVHSIVTSNSLRRSIGLRVEVRWRHIGAVGYVVLTYGEHMGRYGKLKIKVVGRLKSWRGAGKQVAQLANVGGQK